MSKENEIKTNEVGTGVDNNTNEFDTFPKEIPVLELIETSTSDYEEKEMLTSWGDITIIITPITAFETHTDDEREKYTSPGTSFIASKKDPHDESRTIYYVNIVSLLKNQEISLNSLEAGLINTFHEIIDDKQQLKYVVYLNAPKPKEDDYDTFEISGVINKVFTQFTSNTGWLVIDYPQETKNYRDDISNLGKKDKKKNKKKDKKKKK